MGKLDLASKEILNALKLEPRDPYIHEHLGDIYLKLGKRVLAFGVSGGLTSTLEAWFLALFFAGIAG